jgi:hypothetical protein
MIHPQDTTQHQAKRTSCMCPALQFIVTERPLTSAQRNNFTGNGVTGDSIHFPLFLNIYGLFYNVPGARACSKRVWGTGVPS